MLDEGLKLMVTIITQNIFSDLRLVSSYIQTPLFDLQIEFLFKGIIWFPSELPRFPDRPEEEAKMSKPISICVAKILT